MKRMLAAALMGAALAACASVTPEPSGPPAAGVTSSGTWNFGFDSKQSVASATLTGADGSVLAKLTWAPPNGPVQVTDYIWQAGSAKDEVEATLRIDQASARAVGRVAKAPDGRQALQFSVPLTSAVFRSERDGATVSAGTPTRIHTYAPGAGEAIGDMVRSCRTRGS